MALHFATNVPQQLLNDFKSKIKQGHIVTWSYDANHDVFIHETPQWRNKAYLRPVIEIGGLRFNLLGHRGVPTTQEVYAIYHGRFIESMIAHCHDLFTTSSATAKPTNTDVLTTKAQTA
jgi:hypothetical protein